MVGETFAGLSALKTAFDLAKGIKDIDDAVRRNAAVIELQEKILTAQQAQSTLIDQIRELEEKMASFETWEREKQRYDLKPLGWGAFAYMLKKSERGSEPPRWVCTNCFEQKKIAMTIQHGVLKSGEGVQWFCPSCKSTIMPNRNEIKWEDNDKGSAQTT